MVDGYVPPPNTTSSWRCKPLQEYGNYGPQPLIWCVDYMIDHNCHALAIRFYASGKEAYGRWGGIVDLVGRWMRVGGRDGWKMEDDN